MKTTFSVLFLVLLTFGLLLFSACSRIEIENPAEAGQNITTPYTLVARHTGCGAVQQASFQAWLDKNGDSPQEITQAFSFNADVWTASDFDLPMGTHTLTVRADVTTGSWCSKSRSSDERTFFVAPCTDFETAWGEDFSMAPDTLTIEWGETVEKIAAGATKVINLPEDSPYIVDGKLPATVTFGITNLTPKNLKFNAVLSHGADELYHNFLVFCGEGPVTETAHVQLTPGNEPLNLHLEAGDIFNSPADDTRALFFAAKLQVRIYPL